MLLIVLLGFAFTCQLSATSLPSRLNYYDAESELNVIQAWYDMVKRPLDATTSMQQLHDEARNMAGKAGSQMYEYLHRAQWSNIICSIVFDLTHAECLAVTMYTDDSSDKAFYREYNEASTSRVWQPYRVYTTLLLSALQKLAEIDPIPHGARLYRGISFRPEKPNARRLFWKAFSSATLDFQTAKRFAGSNGIIFEFQPPVSRYAAQVRKLSFYSEESEVILLPFEAFDFEGTSGQNFVFKTSWIQKLLNPRGPHPSLDHNEL